MSTVCHILWNACAVLGLLVIIGGFVLCIVLKRDDHYYEDHGK